MEYNFESLKSINQKYHYQHSITKLDVEKTNCLKQKIEKSRKDMPQVGDIVKYYAKSGLCYKNAHIEKVEGNGLYICELPTIPFIEIIDGKLYTNTSGGPWCYIPKNLKYLGVKEKYFKNWGHCGVC